MGKIWMWIWVVVAALDGAAFVVTAGPEKKGDALRQVDVRPDRGVGEFIGLPRQSSWQLHSMRNADEWENEIFVLSPVRPGGQFTTVYQPAGERLVWGMELHFDAGRVMFSMPDGNKKWQIFEMDVDGKNLRQISPTDQGDVHNFDFCYQPNGKIAFISTAPFQEAACNASVNVGMTYLMDADGGNLRQLCFEQDHNFCPTVMNAGERVVRGGSWYDRPKRCRSAFRLSYAAWRKVYNVGFRVVLEAGDNIVV